MRFVTNREGSQLTFFDQLRIKKLVIDLSWNEFKIDQEVGAFITDSEMGLFIYRALFLEIKNG